MNNGWLHKNECQHTGVTNLCDSPRQREYLPQFTLWNHHYLLPPFLSFQLSFWKLHGYKHCFCIDITSRLAGSLLHSFAMRAEGKFCCQGESSEQGGYYSHKQLLTKVFSQLVEGTKCVSQPQRTTVAFLILVALLREQASSPCISLSHTAKQWFKICSSWMQCESLNKWILCEWIMRMRDMRSTLWTRELH